MANWLERRGDFRSEVSSNADLARKTAELLSIVQEFKGDLAHLGANAEWAHVFPAMKALLVMQLKGAGNALVAQANRLNPDQQHLSSLDASVLYEPGDPRLTVSVVAGILDEIATKLTQVSGTKLTQVNGTKLTQVNGTVAGQGCFVATAVYGCPDAPQIQVLRRFRDSVLLHSRPGKCCVRAYYACAPGLSRRLQRRRWALRALRAALDKFVRRLEKA